MPPSLFTCCASLLQPALLCQFLDTRPLTCAPTFIPTYPTCPMLSPYPSDHPSRMPLFAGQLGVPPTMRGHPTDLMTRPVQM